MNIRSIAIAGLLPVLFQAALAIAAEQDFHDIAAAVSAERIERDIQTLVSFGTRHTLSETARTLVASAPPGAGSKPSSIAFPPIAAAVWKCSPSVASYPAKTGFPIRSKC